MAECLGVGMYQIAYTDLEAARRSVLDNALSICFGCPRQSFSVLSWSATEFGVFVDYLPRIGSVQLESPRRRAPHSIK